MPEIVSKVVSRHKNLCPDIQNLCLDIQNLCPDIQKLVLAGAVKVISKVIAHVKPPLKAHTDIHRLMKTMISAYSDSRLGGGRRG